MLAELRAVRRTDILPFPEDLCFLDEQRGSSVYIVRIEKLPWITKTRFIFKPNTHYLEKCSELLFYFTASRTGLLLFWFWGFCCPSSSLFPFRPGISPELWLRSLLPLKQQQFCLLSSLHPYFSLFLTSEN